MMLAARKKKRMLPTVLFLLPITTLWLLEMNHTSSLKLNIAFISHLKFCHNTFHTFYFIEVFLFL